MFRTTCSGCGDNCEVPFRPSGDKPVYCSNCFKKDHSPRNEDRGRRGEPRRRQEMHKAVCVNCGNNCEVPFRPSGDKPIYCSNCFEKEDRSNRSSGKSYQPKENHDKKHDEINAKLDKILSILALLHPTREIKEVNPEKEEKVAEKAPTKSKEEPIKKAPAKKVATKKASPKKVAKKAPAKKVATKKASPKKVAKKTPTKKVK